MIIKQDFLDALRKVINDLGSQVELEKLSGLAKEKADIEKVIKDLQV